MRPLLRALLCIALLHLALAPVSVQAEEPVIHTVQPGENLFRIGLKYNLSWTAIVAANNLPNANVYTGQQLVIPVSGVTNTTSAAAAAPAAAPVTTSSTGTHTVQRGENLFRIALRYGIPTATLSRANNIVNPKLIYVGQVLTIPSSDTPPSVQAAAPAAAPTPAPTPAPAPAPAPAPTAAPAPAQPAANATRWIDVDLTNQRVHAMEGDTVVNSFVVSTGTWRTPTVTGRYNIYVKYTAVDMSGPGYYLADVPYVMYFYRGYGLHGTYWHNNFGTPMSRGCVNMTIADAEWMFNFVSVGTLVNVHY